jgi:hypothetical protein
MSLMLELFHVRNSTVPLRAALRALDTYTSKVLALPNQFRLNWLAEGSIEVA